MIVQVSGPPCGGKSTHLASLHGHVVLDDWDFFRDAGVDRRDHVPDRVWAEWREVIDCAVGQHLADPAARPLAYIQSNPRPRFPDLRDQLTVVVIDPGRAECHLRADADGRPRSTHDWIDRWYNRN